MTSLSTTGYGADEEWRAVAGFEGYYEVSNLGRVRSLSRTVHSSFGATKNHQGRIMSPGANKDGYRRVTFRVDGEHKTNAVHRLVAEAFHGDKKNALHCEVDHIDGVRGNNAAVNLRWVSRGENMFNCRHQRKGELNGFSKLSEVSVCHIKRARGAIPARALAERYGVTWHTIYDIWNERSWRHVA